jgi:hypothetical protein
MLLTAGDINRSTSISAATMLLPALVQNMMPNKQSSAGTRSSMLNAIY